LERFDAKEIVAVVTSTIAIVAFLLAVDYFTAKPSLKISVFTTYHGFYRDSVVHYYKENAIEIPKQLYEDKSLRGLFPKEPKAPDPNDGTVVGTHASDELLIELMGKGRDLGRYLPPRIEMLENHIDKYTYKKRTYAFVDWRGFYDPNTFQPVLDRIKSILSQEQYYVFLAAFIRSREIQHTINVNNDGAIDLKNVEIIIPAPVSKVTENRTKNILDCQIQGQLLRRIIQEDDHMTLILPRLKKGESLGLRVRTRENLITEDDILRSFERAVSIDKKEVWAWFLGIFVGVLLLRWICRGQKKPVH
jgi:hypothetical protein